MKTNYFSSPSILLYSPLALLSLLVASCGSYQNTSYNDNDGIYGDKDRPATRVTQENSQNNQYKEYFGSLQQNNDVAIFTDVENYNTANDTTESVEARGYSSGYSGWGDANENVVVNVYDNSWGYNNWYTPFGYGYGYGWGYGGWYQPYYSLGWGWNSWYGPGYGWGWNNYYGNSWYGNHYHNTYVYNSGIRGRGSRSEIGSRYSSGRNYSTPATRSNSYTTTGRRNTMTTTGTRNSNYNTTSGRRSQVQPNNSGTRTRSYTPATSNQPTRSYTPSSSGTRNNSYTPSAGGGRSSSGGSYGGGGGRSSGGGGRR